MSRMGRPALPAGLLAAGLLGPLLAGCGGALVGDWHLAQAIPNRDVFGIDDVTFRRDGTFTATTTIEGLTMRESGRYEFIGYKLMLRPEAGGQRTYVTMLKPNRLEVKDGNRKVILRKGRRGGRP